MIKGRDIIIVGQQSWDTSIGSNCKNIALEFSKNNRVLYVNYPIDRITKHRGKDDERISKRLRIIDGTEVGLIKIDSNLFTLYPDCVLESINWIGVQCIFDFVNKINNKRYAKSIKKAAVELNFKDFILFNDNDIYRGFYLKEMLEPTTSVYYSRDNMVATDYWKRHGVYLEPKLIAKSDVCVANSDYLKDYCKRYNKNSYYVGQGCDLTLFRDFDRNKSIVDESLFERPVIGYVGAVDSNRLDIDLIIYIAKNKPEWSIILVGPEDDSFKMSLLHNLKNVFFLGIQPVEHLPHYIDSFDVCINPQVVNEITIGNYPRKIDEYLAMGKATVVTKTQAIEVFRGYIYFADGKEEFVRMVERALNENSCEVEQSRIDFATSHTWENSVDLIYTAIANFENQLEN